MDFVQVSSSAYMHVRNEAALHPPFADSLYEVRCRDDEIVRQHVAMPVSSRSGEIYARAHLSRLPQEPHFVGLQVQAQT